MSLPANGETPHGSGAASLPPPRVTDGASSRFGAPVHLVGRDLEVGIIRAFLDRAWSGGGAFLISGDAGVGKSVLIDAAAGYAASIGFMVLRATGAQFEAHVSFAGLHQVLYPLLKNLDQLDELQRRALDSAFGLRQGAAPDRMTISHAALELLVRFTATAAVLIVVDDMPWLDQVSAMILGFVARRTAGTRIGFLAAARTGEEGFLRPGLAVDAYAFARCRIPRRKPFWTVATPLLRPVPGGVCWPRPKAIRWRYWNCRSPSRQRRSDR